MELSDYESILNEIGQSYVQIRKDCLIGCANLLETHEMTLVEKNCMKNCFSKLYYANSHFQKLTAQNLKQLDALHDDFHNKQFKH
jgi:hypothetical protein